MTTIFYDSLCPVCNAEIAFLKKVDKNDQVAFVDIADPSFDASQYGKSIDDFIGSIHGLNAKNELIEGVEVFRQVYQAVGLGWLLNWTRRPVFKPAVDGLYKVFAKIRPKFSKFDGQCVDGRCSVHSKQSKPA